MTARPYGQAGGGAVPPVCPRHPDRVSYVRCQRCERPVCPECQRPAPVGVQCVDCVARAQAAVPARRTVFGGRARDGRPVVTIAIVALCLIVFAAQRVTPGVNTALFFVPGLGAVEPHRFLSAAFLHGSFLHLALNMYALWIVGSVLEPALGRWRFLSLYLVSALGGSVGVLLFASPAVQDQWWGAVVGASGAVFGLFGAVALALRRAGRDATQILVLIAINTVLGFTVPNIAWQAHLGGLVTGVVLAAAYVSAPRTRSTVVGVVATLAVTVVVVALAVAKYALLT
ncbi:rhomboid family intramembrane serine protease [uncultured Georgenia sp.]|uniref:rhomboid family intramembrane serine protease n=1 Tax=uncultured Georgenia sp. TaxID=378209 RepID=UPI00263451C2|nr:rhomboid family intramembrane serine protease [uncultured Georgenia sp.]HLV03783.1 rhomboid family intramembrane serine protease [Actinomycetaceae bacterium]